MRVYLEGQKKMRYEKGVDCKNRSGGLSESVIERIPIETMNGMKLVLQKYSAYPHRKQSHKPASG